MNTYRFDALPSPAHVASAVTLVACAWLTMAMGLILAEEPAAPGAAQAVAEAVAPAPSAAPAAPTAVAASPDARFTIVVEGRRQT